MHLSLNHLTICFSTLFFRVITTGYTTFRTLISLVKFNNLLTGAMLIATFASFHCHWPLKLWLQLAIPQFSQFQIYHILQIGNMNLIVGNFEANQLTACFQFARRHAPVLSNRKGGMQIMHTCTHCHWSPFSCFLLGNYSSHSLQSYFHTQG